LIPFAALTKSQKFIGQEYAIRGCSTVFETRNLGMSGSEAFDPYSPLNVLKPIAAGVWLVDGPEIQFSYLGLKFPFPTRMTLIRLPDGGLWIHSPTSLTDALADEVLQAGPVQFLIAPNTLHYWGIPDWKARFPNALVYAAPGLERSAKRPLPVDQVLGHVPPPEWAGIIDQAVVRGDMLTEVAFFHRPSCTLVLTDLIENFELKRTHSRSYRLLLRLAGAADPDGKAPIDMQLTFWRHRRAVRMAVERMIAWTPERIIIAHGRWYEENCAAELRRAFRWVF
jgi:hypothetical protein